MKFAILGFVLASIVFFVWDGIGFFFDIIKSWLWIWISFGMVLWGVICVIGLLDGPKPVG